MAKHLLVAGFSVLLACSPASAHFLFVRITPPAEGGRAAEVFFSDRAEAGDPSFVDKIAHTKLWVQAAPGAFQPLTVRAGTDRLRAPLPGAHSLVVIGACDYGVLTRKIPFLLRYFPKALAGKAEDLNRMQPSDKVPLEITARIGEDGIRLTALRDGKPVAGAEFHTATAGNTKTPALKADDQGVALWKPSGPGDYSLYTSFISQSPGTRGGKKYAEIRDFATLAFTWPLSKAPDPAAVKLFQEALAARAHWEGFPGFSAHIRGHMDGHAFSGPVSIDAAGTVNAAVKDEAAQSWVQGQLESIVLHRGAGSNARSTGKTDPPVHFADSDLDHPLGRLLIFEGGRFASSYRIRDKQIVVVNRHMGKENMTITVLDNDRTPEGRFLPRSYTVQYWDAATGSLKRTETVQERWLRLGSWDLPAAHTLTIASGTGLTTRSFLLSKQQLLSGVKD
jgi:hypothetical protein